MEGRLSNLINSRTSSRVASYFVASLVRAKINCIELISVLGGAWDWSCVG